MNKEITLTKVPNRIIAGIDVDKLIKTSQETYSKKEKGLARQIATGSSLTRPTEDKHFIVWTANNFWQELTGLKGLPFGRITQISGRSDAGKSSVAAMFMKFAQEQDTLVILFDAERKFSKNRFSAKMGGNLDNLIIIDTNSIIDGTKAVAQIIHSAKEQNPKAKILVVMDSIGAAISSGDNKEDEENMSMQPGQAAKEITWMVKKFTKLANKYMDRDTGEETLAFLAINQVYSTIGGFGPPSLKEKGGEELYYLSSILIQMTRKGDLTKTKDGKKYKFGIKSRCKVKKNHLFDGNETLAETEIIVSAEGVQLSKDTKDATWNDEGGSDDEEGEE